MRNNYQSIKKQKGFAIEVVLLLALGFFLASVVHAHIENGKADQIIEKVKDQRYGKGTILEKSLGSYLKEEDGKVTFHQGQLILEGDRPRFFESDNLTFKRFDFSAEDNVFLNTADFLCSDNHCEQVVSMSQEMIGYLEKRGSN